LDRRLGGTQSGSGHGGEDKNSQPPTGLEPPIIQPVAQRCISELSRLLPVKTLFINVRVTKKEDFLGGKCNKKEIKNFD
jgi:hypothetical protein